MIQQDLVASLKAGDFEGARLFANLLGEQARRDLLAAANADARAEIFVSSTSALTDALHLARVLRAHLGAQLSTNAGIPSIPAIRFGTALLGNSRLTLSNGKNSPLVTLSGVNKSTRTAFLKELIPRELGT